MKHVAIVILDYKNKNDTKECIQSLQKLKTVTIETSIILVNNDPSQKYTVDEFSSNLPLHVINNTENSGYAGGNNVGIKKALENGASFVLLLNNDTIVDPLFLEKLGESFSNEDIGAVSPKIYFAKGYEYHKARYREDERGKVLWYAGGIMDWENVLGHHRGVDEVDHGQYATLEETDFVTGCCILFSKEILEKVGLLDEKYFLYYEDSDINQRIKKLGYKTLYNPASFIYHKNAGSTGGSGSSLQDYYITRNRLLFGMRYAPLRSKIALIKESLSLIFNGREWQKIGVKDFYKGKFGKGSYR